MGPDFAQLCSFEHLRQACRRARKGARNHPDTAAFLFEQEQSLLTLQKELTAGSYRPQVLRSFQISDPKPRIIQAAPFRDRVVHHALCAVLAPLLERSAIDHSFACRIGKGQQRALLQAQKQARKYAFCLKIDILHFFEHLHHPTLMSMLHTRCADRDVLELCQIFLRNGQAAEGRGVPIGNLTSQLFANFYLDKLDHFVVHHTPIQGLNRYMDDILLFAQDKDVLWNSLQELEAFLGSSLQLHLKSSATRLMPSSMGIPYLGFRVYPSGLYFQASRAKRFRQKVKSLNHQPLPVQQRSFPALMAWAQTAGAKTLTLRRRVLINNRVGRTYL